MSIPPLPAQGSTSWYTHYRALDAAARQAAPKSLPINAQTGTYYRLTLSDAGKLITLSNAAPVSLRVPPHTEVPLPLGTIIHLVQMGPGRVTVSGSSSGVTVHATPGPRLADQYSTADLIKLKTDHWLLVGRLSA